MGITTDATNTPSYKTTMRMTFQNCKILIISVLSFRCVPYHSQHHDETNPQGMDLFITGCGYKHVIGRRKKRIMVPEYPPTPSSFTPTGESPSIPHYFILLFRRGPPFKRHP